MENDNKKNLTENRQRSLKNFPIQLFAVIMGLSGVTIAYAKAYHILDFSYLWYFGLLMADTVLFFGIFGAYIFKWIYYPEEVKAEFDHPVKSSFVAAISISFLLISIAYYDFAPSTAIALWFIGAPLHLFFTFRTLRYWIAAKIEITQISPAWFIPIVGNVLVPIIGVDCGPVFIPVFYFVIGIFFWAVLFTIVLYRMIFHAPLPEKLLPTLFILIAPPAVGFISYFKITFGSIDMVSLALYFIALFTLLLLVFIGKTFVNIKFYISWWAYTFPLAAITIATLLMHNTYSGGVTYAGSLALLFLTTVVIGIVTYKTVNAVLHEKICISEE